MTSNDPIPGPARGDWRNALPATPERASLPAIRDVRFDSRQVGAGDLFVCVEGERSDGHEFAAQAVQAGAVALVARTGRGGEIAGLGVPVVEAPDPRAALATLSAAHEDYPARKLVTAGITGTDGKSTTSFLAQAAFRGCGYKTGLLTTIQTRIDDRIVPNPTRLTSQEAPYVQRLLAEMVDVGCTHAVIEATSIGLDMHRVDECAFDAALFTNLSGDHLDYHGTFEKYRAAKGRLFEMLEGGGHRQRSAVAVLNRDDAHWRYFASRTKARVVTYALEDPEADVRVEDVMQWSDGSTFALVADEDTAEGSVRLPGLFNVSNAAAAITLAAALRMDVYAAASGVAACEGVPGRMQRITGAPFPVIVDYAHTPDALRKVLQTLRPVVDGRIISVFGCAGERAKERREGLGAVAAELADYTILTDEDPRTEPSEAIIEEIARAMLAHGATEGDRFERMPDRRAAIARALEVARPGDLVLLTGKGHESTIEYATGAVPWDEASVAAELVAERFG